MEIKTCIKRNLLKIFKYETDFKTYLEDIFNFNLQPYYNLLLIREAAPFATHIKSESKWEQYGIQITEPDRKIPLLVGKETDRFYDPFSKYRNKQDHSLKTEQELELQVIYVYDVSATEAALTGWNTKTRKIEDKEKFYQEVCWFFHQDADLSDRSIDDKIRDVIKEPIIKRLKQKTLGELEREALLEGCLYAISYSLGLDLTDYEMTAFQQMSTGNYSFYNVRYYASILCNTTRAIFQLLHVCEQEAKQNEQLIQMKIEIQEVVEQKIASQSFLEKLKSYFLPVKTKNL